MIHPDGYYNFPNYATTDWDLIPRYMIDGVKHWVEDGIPGGSFQHAIMCNDFMRAARQADHTNCNLLFNWAMLLENFLPPECYGSVESVNRWKQLGGINGYCKLIKDETTKQNSND